MKCPSCGSPMGIEDKFCPYCGEPNKLAIKHQRDMDHFEVEYQSTKDRVFRRTEFLRSHGGNLIVMVLVLITLIVAIVLNFKAWEIGYGIREKKALSYSGRDNAVAQELLSQGDYGKYRGYFDSNDMDYYGDDEFRAVNRVAWSYAELFEHLSSIKNPSSYSSAYAVEYAAEELLRIFTIEREYNDYEGKFFTEDKMVYIRDMQERAGLMAKTYFGLTDEQIEDIPNMSKAKLTSLIEEGLGR